MAESVDLDLMLAAGRGDRSAFGLLVDRHHTSVYRFIYRFLGGVDRQTAEDLAQDTFLRAWQAAPSYEPRAKVLTWLLRIGTNSCLNYRRRSRLRRTLALDAADGCVAGGGSPEESPGDSPGDRNLKLAAAVGSLPPNQRAAIVLRHFHDFSYGEIADVLDTSVSAVESLLFRARMRLRCDLAGSQSGPESPQVSHELGAETL